MVLESVALVLGLRVQGLGLRVWKLSSGYPFWMEVACISKSRSRNPCQRGSILRWLRICALLGLDMYDTGFPKLDGTFLGSPHDKDFNTSGSILGSHYLGKLPY